MKEEFKIVWRPQGWPVGHSESKTVTSWPQVGGLIGNMADECDSILVYCNDKLVLRYDNDGIN
jgi:hypothetical protein